MFACLFFFRSLLSSHTLLSVPLFFSFSFTYICSFSSLNQSKICPEKETKFIEGEYFNFIIIYFTSFFQYILNLLSRILRNRNTNRYTHTHTHTPQVGAAYPASLMFQVPLSSPTPTHFLSWNNNGYWIPVYDQNDTSSIHDIIFKTVTNH